MIAILAQIPSRNPGFDSTIALWFAGGFAVIALLVTGKLLWLRWISKRHDRGNR